MSGRFFDIRSAGVALAVAAAALAPGSAAANDLLHKKTTRYELVRGYIVTPTTTAVAPTPTVTVTPVAPVTPTLAPQAAPSQQSPTATAQAPTPQLGTASPQAPAAPTAVQFMTLPVQQVQVAAPVQQVQVVTLPVQQVQVLAAPVQQFQVISAPAPQVQLIAAPASVATPVDVLVPARHPWLPNFFR